jgi:hypothetical protein
MFRFWALQDQLERGWEAAYLDPNIYDTLKPRRGRVILGSEAAKEGNLQWLYG